MAERFSCARLSADLNEPMPGTASQVRRWVLVEQPGSWGVDALTESALPTHLGEELHRRCREIGARPLLIRRPGQRTSGRRVVVASSHPSAAWAEQLLLDDVEELADLDLSPLARDASVGGSAVRGSLFLTCTNGRHDACCAEYGRGVAAALEATLGESAWECSHIGGDRFAANVLVLPEGLYYGRVTPEDAPVMARRHAEGRLSLEHFRGRSTARFDVQAAESLLREHLGLDRIDAVVGVGRRPAGEAAVEVELAVTSESHPPRWRVELEVAPDPREQVMTCRATRPGFPPRYAERRIEPLPASEPGAPVGGGAR